MRVFFWRKLNSFSQENFIPVFSPEKMNARNTYFLYIEMVKIKSRKLICPVAGIFCKKKKVEHRNFSSEFTEKKFDFIYQFKSSLHA